jgi:hypothetical protein
MGPRTGLDDMQKRKILPRLGVELQTLGRPDRSQLLCRLRSPFSRVFCIHVL